MMNSLEKRLRVLEVAVTPPTFFFWDRTTNTPEEAYEIKYGKPLPENATVINWITSRDPLSFICLKED